MYGVHRRIHVALEKCRGYRKQAATTLPRDGSVSRQEEIPSSGAIG